MPPISIRLPRPEHFTKEGIAEFQDMWRELVQQVNISQGVHGPIPVFNHIDLKGNRVINSGPAEVSTDLLTQQAADPMYSSSTQQAAMEAVGAKMLQTSRRLNDGTQQHKISSDLNTQGSIPPTIVGVTSYTATTTSITVSFPSVIQFGDQSTIAIQNLPIVVTGLIGGSYFVYPYFDMLLGLPQLVADSVNATGTPPVVFSSTATNASQIQNGDGHVPLSNGGMPVTVPAVGTGGGNGGGGIRFP